MDVQQNATKTENSTDQPIVDDAAIKLLKDQQMIWIDYCAVQGMLTEQDGTITRMTITELATKLGVNRSTLHRWKDSIPNFWERVKARRMEIGSQTRTNKVWNGVYLRAAKGDAEQAKIWLGTFDGWQPPAQKHEVDAGGGLADLLQAVRKRQIAEEAESKRHVIDADTTEANA